MIELSHGTFATIAIFAILGVLGCINLAREFYALRHEIARTIKTMVRDGLSRPNMTLDDANEIVKARDEEMIARVGDWTVCMVDDRQRKLMLPQVVEALTKYPERVAWVESPALGDETDEVQS